MRLGFAVRDGCVQTDGTFMGEINPESEGCWQKQKTWPRAQMYSFEIANSMIYREGTFVDQGRKASQHLSNVGMMYVVMLQIAYAIRYFFLVYYI